MQNLAPIMLGGMTSGKEIIHCPIVLFLFALVYT